MVVARAAAPSSPNVKLLKTGPPGEVWTAIDCHPCRQKETGSSFEAKAARIVETRLAEFFTETRHHRYVDTAMNPAGLKARATSGDPVALAQLFVSIPSVNPVLSPGGDGEARMARVAAELLEAWGFETAVHEVAAGRPNVIGRLVGSGPTLLLNGHLDTVGVEGMTVDPFAAGVDGGRLVGRGSCDMKGGVAALMAAARRLSEAGPRPNLIVALTADEEHASLGMADLVAGPEASRSWPGAEVLADFAIVCEPTSLAVMPAHKGFVWLEAEFRGRAAHGSRPEVGVDAIRHAGLFLAALDRYEDALRARPRHPLLGWGSLHAGTISGGTAESVYPDRCALSLERRTLPKEEVQQVVEEFTAVLDALQADEPGVDATLRMTLHRPGTEVPGDSLLVRGLQAAAEAEGTPAPVEGMTAWVDAAFLNEAGVPSVCYGPGSIEQAHTVDEWIAVDEIETCASVLERFARTLASDS
jgi:acetylornithine deacetylase